MRYGADGGEWHGVGLGSDFDGAAMPSGLDGATGLQNLIGAMRGRGFDWLVIEKVCFTNWLRVLGRTWGGNGRKDLPRTEARERREVSGHQTSPL
jgi:microsomal dipeptidase-like Zn-dependent dipeptidase